MIQQSHSWAYIWEKKKKRQLKGCMCPGALCSTIYNNQNMETT